MAFVEDGAPAQTGLGSFEREELEQRTVVGDRHAPFLVVVGDVGGLIERHPGAALHGAMVGAVHPVRGGGYIERNAGSGAAGIEVIGVGGR